MSSATARACALGAVLLGAPFGAVAAPPDTHLQLCAACHGPSGNSIVPDNPKLAGLAPEYILRQLVDFKRGKRVSTVMAQIVSTLDEDSLRAVSEYFGEQKATPSAVTDGAAAAKGKLIFEDGVPATGVPACTGCHGNDGMGDAKYPRLAGQHAAYTEKQLAAFKAGTRANDAKGVMVAVAQRMSEAEMRAVAQYVSGLKEEGQ